MRQDIVDVLHHHVDVKVQHPVDRVRVGIDQVAADINTGIGVQDVELACLLQDLRHKTAARLLSLGQPELRQARNNLLSAGLIAYQAPLYQVLSLEPTLSTVSHQPREPARRCPLAQSCVKYWNQQSSSSDLLRTLLSNPVL